ncbi:RHS repeat-associated core domain-containing protein [Pseudomonas leptonychotis]|uniref:RHS repeat-associated core domain-containing protein n=1 Tax=Pseudomonas leptonychotis TaxID=2448482 RepID=UPI00386346C6
MPIFRFGHFSACLLAGAAALFSSVLHAKPGLDHQYRGPHYNTEVLQLDVLDLQVQALGNPIRMLRSWKNGQWVWNERWEDLKILGPADANAPLGAADSLNADRPYAVVRGGQSYLRANSTVQGQDVTFNNLPKRSLTALQRGLAGYRWQDVQGNRGDYDAQGRMTGYQDHNAIKVSLVRDTEGRVIGVKDHHGEQLVALTYTGNNLASVKDYSGREIKYEYTGNQLSAVIDVLGQRWQYHYNANGLAGYTDPLGQRTTYVLGKKDSVQEVKQADGRWIKYSYGYEQNTEEFYVRQSDQSGLVKEKWYDRLGQLVRQQEAGETLLTRSYLLSDRSSDVSKIAEAYRITGRSLAVTREISQRQGRAPSPFVAQMIEQDAQGNRTTTEYNKYDQVIRVQYPDGSEIKNSYDPATNKVSERINERGIKTQYRYDGKGNLIEQIDAAGTPAASTTTYAYTPLGQQTEQNNPVSGSTPAAKWQYQYDGKGNRTKVIDPLNHETLYSHDAQGNVLTLINALNKVWTSTYDAAGNLTSLTTPLTQTVTYNYDNLGQRTQTIAPNSAEMLTAYNAAGLPKSITDAANAKVLFEYDANQRLVAVIDPLGNKNERQYDARGRLLNQKDANGNTTQYQYDKERLSGIDYPTYQERYQYDSREQIKSETREYSEGGTAKTQTDQYRYLADGLLEQHLDAASSPTSGGYDALGRFTSSADAEGGITQFSYDVRGNLIRVIDPAGRITQFSYDARDAVISEVKPGDSTTPRTERRYRYDAVGNLTQTISPDGRVSQYQYDDANRLIQTRHFSNAAQAETGGAERTTTYSYSELNRLQSYEDEESKAVYQHDVLGRVTEVTVTYKTATPVFSKTIGYSYDANGRKATYSNAEQQTYSYSYSAHGQLNGLSIPGEGSISLQNFNWLQPQNILYPGGSSLQVVHDGLLRYSSRDLKDPAGNPIQSHSYQYDVVGNITAIAGQDGKADYGYDKLYRLTEAKYPEGDSRTNEAYAYDGVGNRLDEKTSKAELDISQWQYNAHNQLVSHDGIGYRYNADGHLIEKGALQENGSLIQSGSIDHWRYQYDSRERLVEVQKNGQPLVKYAYNPLGQRISKTLLAGNHATYYLYSEEGLVGEYDAQGQLKQEYAYDPTKPWMSQPLFTRAQRNDTQAWAVGYFGTSHLGTPEVAFEKSGEVTWRAKAQAFGETQVTLNIINNALRFPGQYFDQETGLYQNYFRDYDPQLGRYVQSDPIGLSGGLSTYSYVMGAPLMNFDIFGLASMDVRRWRSEQILKNPPSEREYIRRQVYGWPADVRAHYFANDIDCQVLGWCEKEEPYCPDVEKNKRNKFVEYACVTVFPKVGMAADATTLAAMGVLVFSAGTTAAVSGTVAGAAGAVSAANAGAAILLCAENQTILDGALLVSGAAGKVAGTAGAGVGLMKSGLDSVEY